MTSSKRIWASAEPKPDEYYDFRICFDGEKGKYSFRVTCDSQYALYKNGRLVCFGQYGDFPDHKVYDTVDITESVTKGENEFILTVWYFGVDSQTYIDKGAGVMFSVSRDGEVIARSNEETLCRSSAGYVAGRAEKITDQLGIGFAYDSRLPAGEWRSAAVLPRWDTLCPRPVKKLTLHGRCESRKVKGGYFRFDDAALPSAVKQSRAELCVDADEADGVFGIYDLGRERAGILELEVEAETECELDIGWGEHLADGRCRTAVRNFAIPIHIPAGRSRLTFPMLRLGCRYIQCFASASDIKLVYLGLRETVYPLNVLPASLSGTRKKIYETAVDTLRLCMHEHYEDCPWREQALYALDSRNQMLCGYFAFGEYGFARASLELISRGVRPDGLLPLCAPAGTDFPIPSFSLVYFIQMNEYLKYSGDADFLREKYGMLTRLMDVFLGKERENGLITNFYGKGGYWNFYEWSDGMEGRFDEQVRSVEAPLNAFLSLALEAFAEISASLGYDERAEELRREKSRINEALRREFFDREVGLFGSFSDRLHGVYSVLTNSLCLLCGAADGIDKTVMLRVLAEGGSGDTGLKVVPNTISMNGFRFDALLAENREKYAPVVLDEIDRTYSYMLENGATAFWETIKGAEDFGGAGSMCHGWSAMPVYYYKTLAEG